jgi:hypothetical protein
MMKLISPLRKDIKYVSTLWHASKTMPGVRFAIKRVSLHQRIELNHRVRELALKNEFLRTGDTEDRLQAALSDLLVTKLYLEWGLASVDGLLIDGETPSTAVLIDRGPESLAAEIAGAIQTESTLTDEERKNS